MKTEPAAGHKDRFATKVPRYTSYPTAPHFNDAVDAMAYRGWLASLDPTLALSLYFHIPFCETLCWFCACHTKVVRRYGPVAAYLAAMLREIDLVADALPARFRARHLHWGGGSPTILRGGDWTRIVDRLRARFDIGDDAELAVELDPRTATRAYVAALAAAGVNRASIGVQDIHPEVQKAINRIQPFEVTAQVVRWLRDHGIHHINMDLIYGLPHQTTRRVVRMVDRVLSLRPARVALFGYAHVPWMKSHQKMIDESALPDALARWDQCAAAAARLERAGYLAIGLDHFALPDDDLAIALGEGRLHRNFQGYTTDTAKVLLGFGASAIGALPGGYVQNAAPLHTYRDAVAAGNLPVARGFALKPEDRLRGEVIERLMCELWVDVDEVCRRHRADALQFDTDIAKLAPLRDDGVVKVEGHRISVTGPGRPLVRLVASAFDAYLKDGGARHSAAV